MVDAGSAGTRAHIFTWNSSDSYPYVTPFPSFYRGIVVKSHTPLSQAATDENAIPKIFQNIILQATKAIPSSYIHETKMYIYATAGLRILPISDQAIIMENTFSYLSQNSPFKILKKNVRIMSGAEEAVYGWISVQHLLNISLSPTYGSIDMGGASIQVAFETKARKNAHRIIINNKSFTIFATSMLGFGVNEAMKKILHVQKNPCFPKGYFSNSIEGTGSFEKCHQLIKSLKLPSKISDETKKIKIFYGMASFFYTNDFFGLEENSTLDHLNASLTDFCHSNWTYLNEKYKSNSFLKNYCFFGSFQITFLSDGFGFDFSQNNIFKSGNLKGAELSWAIGAMMKEIDSVKVDPFFIPSKLPIIFLNLFIICTFIQQFLKHRKKAKSGFLSQVSRLL